MDHKQRDADICADHKAGHDVAQLCQKHGLKRQRIYQILKRGGISHARIRSARTKFLGISISEETKEALKQKATDEGTSVSKLTSDALDALVEK